jgi:hypothetical protein
VSTMFELMAANGNSRCRSITIVHDTSRPISPSGYSGWNVHFTTPLHSNCRGISHDKCYKRVLKATHVYVSSSRRVLLDTETGLLIRSVVKTVTGIVEGCTHRV